MRQLTMDRLEALYLRGMKQALSRQIQDPRWAEASFDERLANLLETEELYREERLLQGRVRRARLGHTGRIEDLEVVPGRRLDRSLLDSLLSCRWIKERHNVLLTGPTGVGKTFLACAIAHRACQAGFSVRFLRLPRLLSDLAAARADGTYQNKLAGMSRIDLVVLDDWLVAPIQDTGRRDLLEIFEDRYSKRSTLVAAQLPPENWHEVIGEPTLADAILDRLVHNAYHLKLEGESMRKARGIAHGGTLDQTS